MCACSAACLLCLERCLHMDLEGISKEGCRFTEEGGGGMLGGDFK